MYYYYVSSMGIVRWLEFSFRVLDNYIFYYGRGIGVFC